MKDVSWPIARLLFIVLIMFRVDVFYIVLILLSFFWQPKFFSDSGLTPRGHLMTRDHLKDIFVRVIRLFNAALLGCTAAEIISFNSNLAGKLEREIQQRKSFIATV